jgi:hypothetical protein
MIRAGVTGPTPKDDITKANDFIAKAQALHREALALGLVKTANKLNTCIAGIAYEARDVINHYRTGTPINDIHEIPD